MKLPFFPPFQGVNLDAVRIQEDDFSVEEEISKIKQLSSRIGGVVSFLGTARDFSKGHTVCKLDFEHYPQMAQKALAAVREKALEQFDVLEITIIHRMGEIEIGENIVLIVVAAEHRQAAFSACAWCIDELKKTVPIWKREITPDGTVWVEDRP
jgi:molybdopterin synthase catalytic subunit